MRTFTTPSIKKLASSLTLTALLVMFATLVKANPKPDKAVDANYSTYLLAMKTAYERLQCPQLSFDAFAMAWNGFLQLKETKKIINDSILTIVDFTKPSTENRLFIINTLTLKVVLQTLVAHGRNSGDVYAQKFSNTMSSYQSSLGVYVTGNTYQGKHGYSLVLNGMEKGINDMARERAVVIHGADYVSPQYISQYGRIGRSFGCPAVSYDISKKMINLIKDGTCLFLYHPSYQKMNGLAALGMSNEMAQVVK